MFTFLSPLLIWGTLLGAIPIIIHLLNRRRFRRVEWAPMRYLKLTIRRNRRRIQIEQLLLLLVRIALPVLLFLLLARPVLNPTGLEAGSWAGADEPGRPGRRLAEHGLRDRRSSGVPPGPRGRRGCDRGGQPAGPLYPRRGLGPAHAPSSTRSRGRAARSSRAMPSRCRSPRRTPPGRPSWPGSTRWCSPAPTRCGT